MLPLYSTTKVCGSLASISTFIFTDMTNVDNYGPGFLPPAPGIPPSFSDTSKVYAFAFDRWTGVVTKDSATDQGGDFEVHKASMYIPRSRSEIEVLLQRMRNRFLLVIGIDRYGNQHILYNARRSFHHTTGDKPGTRNGYEVSFTAPSDYLLPAIAGNGDIDTAPPIGNVVPDYGGDDCCIFIQPIKISYYPAPTGNEMNLNELVTTNDDTVYFIDKNGRSIILNRPAPVYYRIDVAEGATGNFITLPDWVPLPNPDDYPSPTYSESFEISRRFWVKLAPRWLTYEGDDIDMDVGGWYMDYGSRRIYFETSIDGAVLEFYSYTHIPAIPL